MKWLLIIGVYVLIIGCASKAPKEIMPPKVESKALAKPPRVVQIGQIGNGLIYSNWLGRVFTNYPMNPQNITVFKPTYSSTNSSGKAYKWMGTTNFISWYDVSDLTPDGELPVHRDKKYEFFKLVEK